MKRRNSPPDKAAPTGEGRSLVAVLSQGKKDTPQQRAFQKLVAKIERTRELIKSWDDYTHHYSRRLAGEIRPLEAKLREKQREMALLIDELLSRQDSDPRTRLRKSDRSTLRELLQPLLHALPDEGSDEKLEALRDKYVPDDPDDDLDIEELLKQAREMLEEDADEADRSKARKSHKKQAADAEVPAPTMSAVSPSLRDAYRKLVSVLHPDREADPQERERKNELMQRVNRAYETQDLLTLLDLQIELTNFDVGQLSAPERITQYQDVLRQQLARLETQLSALRLVFAPLMGPNFRTMSVQAVDKQLSIEIGELKGALQDLMDDLVVFRDPRKLRARLDEARQAMQEERYIEEVMMEVQALMEMDFGGFAEEPRPSRRRKKAKGSRRRRPG